MVILLQIGILKLILHFYSKTFDFQT